jgi:hypothetical protein
MFISLVAMIRQKIRRDGYLAKNKFEAWLDNKYLDKFLKMIYANIMFVVRYINLNML